ncbi:MAG: hypothetical protein DI562_03600 [Stenotrophomonas acidaminiphila]|nr:MAG: hypothetical protein DI562_03600 [Stenotrophomonas acidaminiphila]
MVHFHRSAAQRAVIRRTSGGVVHAAAVSADWKPGRMKLPGAGDTGFIPFPDEPVPPASTTL